MLRKMWSTHKIDLICRLLFLLDMLFFFLYLFTIASQKLHTVCWMWSITDTHIHATYIRSQRIGPFECTVHVWLNRNGKYFWIDIHLGWCVLFWHMPSLLRYVYEKDINVLFSSPSVTRWICLCARIVSYKHGKYFAPIFPLVDRTTTKANWIPRRNMSGVVAVRASMVGSIQNRSVVQFRQFKIDDGAVSCSINTIEHQNNASFGVN